MSYYDEIKALAPSAFFTMGTNASTEPDLMGGAAGTYYGSVTHAQAAPYSGMSGGNAVTASGSGAQGGLSVGSAGTYEFSGTSPFSVSYWIKFPTVDTLFNRHLGTEAGSNGWGATHHPTFGISFTRWTSAGTQETYFADVLPITAGTWYHCVGIYSGTTNRHIVNGVDSGANASTGSLLSSGPSVLRVGSSNQQTKTNTMCDFGIWNRALSVAEAQVLFRAPKRAAVTY